MARGSKTRIKAHDGEITHQQHETDSPIIPIQHLERLHQFKPDAVDWMFQQTELEAHYRRTEGQRVNTFVFAERSFGQICAMTVGLAGIGGGSFAVLKHN